MKKTNISLLTFGLPLFALALICFVPPVAAQPSNETVSAVGAAPSETPRSPDGYPPQPVSVAPAEEATPAASAPGTTTISETESPGATAGTSMTPPPAAAPMPAAPSSAATAAMAPVPANPIAPPSAQGLTPVPKAADGSVAGTNVMGDNGAMEKHSGTYYDSNAIVPDSDLARSGATGPRKVDPAREPGQTFVVVEPGAKASSFEGQYVAATRALKLGRYAAAMEMFEKLYKRNHKDPRILMGLAVAQQGAGFSESASRTYEDLLKVQPNNADAIVNLMGIMRTQYPSVTLKKLMELRNKYPSNAGIPAQIGLVNAELKNYDDARQYFEVAASMDPRNSSHIYNMAIVTDQKGDSSEAIKLYERALQLDASYGDVASSLPREQIYDRLVVLRRKV